MSDQRDPEQRRPGEAGEECTAIRVLSSSCRRLRFAVDSGEVAPVENERRETEDAPPDSTTFSPADGRDGGDAADHRDGDGERAGRSVICSCGPRRPATA